MARFSWPPPATISTVSLRRSIHHPPLASLFVWSLLATLLTIPSRYSTLVTLAPLFSRPLHASLFDVPSRRYFHSTTLSTMSDPPVRKSSRSGKSIYRIASSDAVPVAEEEGDYRTRRGRTQSEVAPLAEKRGAAALAAVAPSLRSHPLLRRGGPPHSQRSHPV